MKLIASDRVKLLCNLQMVNSGEPSHVSTNSRTTNDICAECGLPALPVLNPDEHSSCEDGRPLGHNRHGSKSGGGLLYPFPWGKAESPSNSFQLPVGAHLTRQLRRGLPLYQVVSISIQPYGHNRHGSKSGGCCAPFCGERWIPI